MVLQKYQLNVILDLLFIMIGSFLQIINLYSLLKIFNWL